jgi:hypothetical protein
MINVYQILGSNPSETQLFFSPIKSIKLLFITFFLNNYLQNNNNNNVLIHF